jgi:acyl-CoA reductase-like NAD-dependent aldehyde dehydrogenase
MNIGQIKSADAAQPQKGPQSPEIAAVDKKIREVKKQMGELKADDSMPPEKKAEKLAKLQERLAELGREKQSLLAKAEGKAQQKAEGADIESMKELAEKLEEEQKKRGTGTGRMEPGQFLNDWA